APVREGARSRRQGSRGAGDARRARRLVLIEAPSVAAPLSPATRATMLRELSARELDLLVVGGGITGAGIGRDAALRGPTVAPAGLHGAATFTEYLTDDARLVLANVIDLCRAGGLAVNHCRAVAVDKGRVDVEDTTTGERFTIRARVIVNAGGPWVDELRKH